MKFWNSCVLGFFVLVVIAHAAASEKKVQICGKHLRVMIQLVCKGNYHSHHVRKRRDVRPFNFNEVISRMRRELVVSECCKRACSLETIKTYCHSTNDNGKKDEEIFHEYSKKYQLLSNTLARETDDMHRDEPPRETSRSSMYISNEIAQGAPSYENFAYHDFQNRRKGKLVWGNYYD